jgi:LPXTG-motif cell wall-anchored protein
MRESGVFQPVTAMTAYPAANYSGGVLQFEDYNENNKWYEKCAEYRTAVNNFNDFRAKVIALYGKRPRADVFLGQSGRTKPKQEDKFLRSERAANQQLKSLQAIAVNTLKKCKRAEGMQDRMEAGEIPVDTSLVNAPTATPPVDTTTVSGGGAEQTSADSGGGSMTLIIGVGAVALLGGAAFLVLKKKKSKKKAGLTPTVGSADAAGVS